MRRTLCLWLPNWPIQKLVVARPELKGQRIVLICQHPQRGQWVAAVSPAAGLDGIRIGVPLSEAKAIATKKGTYDGKMPHDQATMTNNRSQSSKGHGSLGFGHSSPLYVFPYDPDGDRAALEQLALNCQSFSPIVGLEKADPPSSLLLDVSGLAHLFGGERQLAFQVVMHCRQLGYLACAAIADTIGLAWAFAHRAKANHNAVMPDDQAFSNDQAPMTKEPSKTFSLGEGTLELGHSSFVLPSGDRSTFHRLPVEALRLDAETVDTLHQLGIERISQLVSLPRAGLLSRFGDRVNWRIDQATGVVEEVIEACRPPADFLVWHVLDFPTDDRETIHAILARRMEDLCRQMRCRQRGAVQWQIRLQCRPAAICFDISLFQPAAHPAHLLQLVDTQLQRHPLPSAVAQIEVRAVQTVLLSERQRQLFDENPRLDRPALAQLIDRLSNRLGAENVLGVRLRSTAQPEQAYQFQPLVGPLQPGRISSPPATAKASSPRSGQSAAPRRSPATAHRPLDRPLCLLAQPLPLDVVSIAGQGPPELFWFGRRRCRAHRHWGPERIETSWWRDPTIQRDYWRVETDQGNWLWLFRDLDTHRWYLQGTFE